MTEIRVAIDRLILHAPHQGVSPELASDLGPLITVRLEQLAAGHEPDRSRIPISDSERIADRVASEIWRSISQHREAT